MSLFTKKSAASSFIGINKLIHGFPKAGKSPLCSKFIDSEGREPYFFMTEPSLGDLKLYHDRVTSWEGVKALTEKITSNKTAMQKEHSGIILDLANEIYEMGLEYYLNKFGVDDLGDVPHGKAWSALKVDFKTVIRSLLNTLPLTFVCHSKETEITVNDKKEKLLIPDLAGPAANLFMGKADAIGMILPQYGSITFQPSRGITAGSRNEAIRKSYKMHHDDLSKTIQEIERDFQGGSNESA